jgi:hypothetical protein
MAMVHPIAESYIRVIHGLSVVTENRTENQKEGKLYFLNRADEVMDLPPLPTRWIIPASAGSAHSTNPWGFHRVANLFTMKGRAETAQYLQPSESWVKGAVHG